MCGVPQEGRVQHSARVGDLPSRQNGEGSGEHHRRSDEGWDQRLCSGHQSMDAAARWQREPDGEGHLDRPRPGCGVGAQEHRKPAEQRQGKGEGEGRENGPP